MRTKKSAHVVQDNDHNNSQQWAGICLHCNEKMIIQLPMRVDNAGKLMIYFSRLHANCPKPPEKNAD